MDEIVECAARPDGGADVVPFQCGRCSEPCGAGDQAKMSAHDLIDRDRVDLSDLPQRLHHGFDRRRRRFEMAITIIARDVQHFDVSGDDGPHHFFPGAGTLIWRVRARARAKMFGSPCLRGSHTALTTASSVPKWVSSFLSTGLRSRVLSSFCSRTCNRTKPFITRDVTC